MSQGWPLACPLGDVVRQHNQFVTIDLPWPFMRSKSVTIDLRSQFVTSSFATRGGRHSRPFYGRSRRSR